MLQREHVTVYAHLKFVTESYCLWVDETGSEPNVARNKFALYPNDGFIDV